jgi:glycosyltransferase involved in cell wall biosynthesis
MSNYNKNISVVIPVYNSKNTLVELCDRLNTVLPGISKEYEIILVNDGSKDTSGNVINQISKNCECVKGVHLMRNYGQHNALLCGIRIATYELIVTLDDDLQNPPEEIPKMLEKLNQGYDVVYGSPEKEQHGLFRDLASIIVKIALNMIMGIETAKNVSDFRIFRKDLRNAFAQFNGTFIFIDVLLTWGTKNFSSIKVQHNSRKFGKSNYSLGSLFIHAINMVTGFTVFPLRVASILGFLVSFFGFIVFIYVVIEYILFNSSVPGFTFLASIIAIFSGAQLLTIGLIGEYISRLYFQSIDKPAYIIKESAENLTDDNSI